MESIYPASPDQVPADLVEPSSRYRRQAWLAMASLAMFVVAYLGLVGWMSWTSYRLFSAVNGDAGNVFLAISTGFLALFLIKALFFLERGQMNDEIEVTAQDQPRLFEFLHRLADELGAPRPYRVYLSPSVNACVFYDLSLLNLIIPSRKNLDIGLELVNVLSIGELKAVLAHEFGHFAQRTMAVGRWVYISHQIATHIVAKRDAFDRFLAYLSRLDIRIGWIGWLFRLIVWAIRSAVELLFSVVVLAQRAMSREMEFQADLVAVSVTGSDALIHALHKLTAADYAWSRAVSFAVDEANAGHRATDVLSLQDRVIQTMRGILSDPAYGAVPERPANNPRDHKVFKTSLTAPPHMWATHPSNADREANAKRRYISAEIDQRTAWDIFDDINGLRGKVSLRVTGEAEAQCVQLDESLKRLDAQYTWMYLKPVFRGTYLMRSTVINAANVSELYGVEPTDPVAALDALYPASLTDDVKERRALEEERASLRTLNEGTLKRTGPVATYRGRDITRSDLSALLDAVDKELASIDARLHKHDRSCRITHLVAARRTSTRSETYLRGLLTVHHYTTHAEADLIDAKALFYLRIQVEFSRKWPARANRAAIVHAGQVVYDALARVHSDSSAVHLDSTLLKSLGTNSWREYLQELKLNPPTDATLGDWVKVCDSWIDSALSCLSNLRFFSLEQLLTVEQSVADATRRGEVLPEVPEPPQVPALFPTMCPGQEREKPNRNRGIFGASNVLSGYLETAAKAVAAACVIGTVVWIGQISGHSTVNVYNALGRPIHVTLGELATDIPPFGHRLVEVGDAKSLHVVATASDGSAIDEFDATLSGRGVHDVYNVARAGVLVSWTASYGNAAKVPPHVLGSPHWLNSHADFVFEEPPNSIETQGGGGTRSVLQGFGFEDPEEVLSPVDSEHDEMVRIIRLHARWDEPSSPFANKWQALLKSVDK